MDVFFFTVGVIDHIHPPGFNVVGCAVGLCICLLTPICSDKGEEQRDGTCLTMVSGVMGFCVVCVCVFVCCVSARGSALNLKVSQEPVFTFAHTHTHIHHV